MSGRDASGARSGAHWRDAPAPGDVEAVRALVARVGVFSAAEVAIAAELVEERLRNGLASGYHFVLADRVDGLAGYPVSARSRPRWRASTSTGSLCTPTSTAGGSVPGC